MQKTSTEAYLKEKRKLKQPMEGREIRNMTENEMHRLKEFLKLSCGR